MMNVREAKDQILAVYGLSMQDGLGSLADAAGDEVYLHTIIPHIHWLHGLTIHLDPTKVRDIDVATTLTVEQIRTHGQFMLLLRGSRENKSATFM
jgi:hypothetical protein